MAITYQLRNCGAVEAVLWKGKASDLALLPEFNILVEMIHRIDKTGLLVLEIDGDKFEAIANQTYIVYHMGVSKFSVVRNTEFEKVYEAVSVYEKSS